MSRGGGVDIFPYKW